MNIIKVAVVGVIGLMLILLATQTPSWAESTPVITHSSQVTRTKLATALPLAYTPSPKTYKFVRVAELTVNDLQPGDLIQIDAAGEASTQGSITRAMHARYVKATKTNSDLSSEGLLLARPMGTNVTNEIHHSTLTAAGAFVADAQWSGSVKIMFVMYAASLNSASDTRSLIVDYVELRATVTRLR